jgi:hypothetical protein
MVLDIRLAHEPLEGSGLQVGGIAVVIALIRRLGVHGPPGSTARRVGPRQVPPI